MLCLRQRWRVGLLQLCSDDVLAHAELALQRTARIRTHHTSSSQVSSQISFQTTVVICWKDSIKSHWCSGVLAGDTRWHGDRGGSFSKISHTLFAQCFPWRLYTRYHPCIVDGPVWLCFWTPLGCKSTFWRTSLPSSVLSSIMLRRLNISLWCLLHFFRVMSAVCWGLQLWVPGLCIRIQRLQVGFLPDTADVRPLEALIQDVLQTCLCYQPVHIFFLILPFSPWKLTQALRARSSLTVTSTQTGRAEDVQ